MQNRSEKAIAGRGQISSSAQKSLKKFHQRTAEKLVRRISCFTTLLRRETDPKKRCQLKHSIAGWRAEMQALYDGWMRSRIRSDMAEDYPATMRAMDEVLRVKLESRSDDIKSKYRRAGRIIDRLKQTG